MKRGTLKAAMIGRILRTARRPRWSTPARLLARRQRVHKGRGYTTGLFELRAGGASDTVGGAGHYVTVWRRDAKGAWKMAADIGTPHRYVPRPADAGCRVSGSTASLGSNAWAQLQAQDSSIGAAAAPQSGPLLAAMTNDARLHRAGSLPAVGVAALRQALAGDDRPYRSKGLGGGTSHLPAHLAADRERHMARHVGPGAARALADLSAGNSIRPVHN